MTDISYLDALGRSLDGPPTEPLANVADIGIGDMLDTEPANRRWILDRLLPVGVVGLLAAGGGTGKSFLSIQLAISVASGRPFLGVDVDETGGVLMVAAEDEREEVHRRLWRIVEQMKADGALGEMDLAQLRERLFVVPRVGMDNRLTAQSDHMVMPTGRAENIAALVEQLPEIKLIVLDPVSRFRGGEENNNEHATRFVEIVESLRTKTEATVLLPHHVSKNGLVTAAENITIEALRGASALVDGVRWAAAMATMRKDVAEKYGIDPDDAGRYVRLDTVKNNYAAPWSGMWLERLHGGVLVPAGIERLEEQHNQRRNNQRYQETLNKLTGLIEQHQEQGKPLTRNGLRNYAGRDGVLGVGDQTLRSILERAIAEGHIKERTRQDGNGKELRTWI